eukprot:SAG11_NODE_8_length_31217_cov_52.169677_18_plen_60_part_00
MRILVSHCIVTLGQVCVLKAQTQLNVEKNGQKNDQGIKNYELDCRPSRLLTGCDSTDFI